MADIPALNMEDIYKGVTPAKKVAKAKPMRAKLEYLQELIVDSYIEALESNKLHPKDFAPVITLLNQNKVVSTPSEGETQHSKVKKIMQKKRPIE